MPAVTVRQGENGLPSVQRRKPRYPRSRCKGSELADPRLPLLTRTRMPKADADLWHRFWGFALDFQLTLARISCLHYRGHTTSDPGRLLGRVHRHPSGLTEAIKRQGDVSTDRHLLILQSLVKSTLESQPKP